MFKKIIKFKNIFIVMMVVIVAGVLTSCGSSDDSSIKSETVTPTEVAGGKKPAEATTPAPKEEVVKVVDKKVAPAPKDATDAVVVYETVRLNFEHNQIGQEDMAYMKRLAMQPQLAL